MVVSRFSSGAIMRKSLQEIGGHIVQKPPYSLWDEIADMENEKRLIEQRILHPLLHKELAKKHGVITPKTILLFGPPGTGKTIFAKAIAGKLGWSFVEIHPSELATSSLEQVAHRIKHLFERLVGVEEMVVFFDEFEELALRPELASESQRLISNEMLKQLPVFKENERALLICATNNVRHLNPALLRPGRFDIIMPIGPLNRDARKKIFEKYISSLNVGEVDIDALAEKTERYTPADIQYVCMEVAHLAFEAEFTSGRDYKVSTQDLLRAIENHKPTVTEEDLKKFREDATFFCRSGYCPIF
ncbi:MAG: ATP-binding protein [Candidatus Bathyarchaeia archaeon]